jgi:hypothetical protein
VEGEHPLCAGTGIGVCCSFCHKVMLCKRLEYGQCDLALSEPAYGAVGQGQGKAAALPVPPLRCLVCLNYCLCASIAHAVLRCMPCPGVRPVLWWCLDHLASCTGGGGRVGGAGRERMPCSGSCSRHVERHIPAPPWYLLCNRNGSCACMTYWCHQPQHATEVARSRALHRHMCRQCLCGI